MSWLFEHRRRFIGAYWAGLKSDGKSTGCSTLVGSKVIC